MLPFANLNNDTETGCFADGLTQEVTNAVTRLADVRVVARTSSLQFKDRVQDVRLVGEELRVEKVLLGSVRRTGTKLRVVAQLASVADETFLWSEVFEREMTDIFGAQEDISNAIVHALRARLVESLDRGGPRDLPDSPSASLYLKAHYCWSRFTPPALERSIPLYRGALGQDAGWARAWAGLADACTMYALHGPTVSEPVIALARTAARKARDLGDSLSEAHTAAGLVAWLLDWDWDRADRELVLATQLDSGCAAGHLWHAGYLSSRGMYAAAQAAADRVNAINPVMAANHGALGWVPYHQGDLERAEAHFRRALELDPDFYLPHLGLGWTCALRSHPAEGLVEFEKAFALSAGAPASLAGLGYCSGVLGRTREAQGKLAELQSREPASGVRLAEVWLGLGNPEEAIRSLEDAVRQRDPNAVHLRVLPQFAPLRKYPKLLQLIENMGEIARGEGAQTASGA